MQIILQEDILNLGNAGDIVTVRDGYGRNFLLPQHKAVIADPSNVKLMEHHKRVVAAKQAKRKLEAEALAKKLAAVTLTIARETAEDETEGEGAVPGKIFGSVTMKDLAEALRHKGFTIDRHALQLREPIRALGHFDIPIKLHAEVTATIKVVVEKK